MRFLHYLACNYLLVHSLLYLIKEILNKQGHFYITRVGATIHRDTFYISEYVRMKTLSCLLPHLFIYNLTVFSHFQCLAVVVGRLMVLIIEDMLHYVVKKD